MKIAVDTSQFTEEQIIAFAEYRGYRTEVMDEETGEVVENPQAPIDYIAEKGKEMVDKWLAERSISDIKKVGRESMATAIEEARVGIASATTIEK